MRARCRYLHLTVTGALVLVVTLVIAGVVGGVWKARSGRMTGGPARAAGAARHSPTPRDSAGGAARDPGLAEALAGLGLEPGQRATLLQFSSPFCAPCRRTRALLATVAAAVPGVRHLEVDVAAGDAQLDLVRRVGILRTPTTLVLDADGREVGRASGVPRQEQVLAVLGPTVDPLV